LGLLRATRGELSLDESSDREAMAPRVVEDRQLLGGQVLAAGMGS
jgi:hypothetical protein